MNNYIRNLLKKIDDLEAKDLETLEAEVKAICEAEGFCYEGKRTALSYRIEKINIYNHLIVAEVRRLETGKEF